LDYATLFGGAITEVTSAIGDILPIAVPVLGSMLGIGIAIKVIRKVAK